MNLIYKKEALEYKRYYTELALNIKKKLISDNKLQLYLDWETNLEYKIYFESL